MIIVPCVQGSLEWHKARAGVITASMFRVARERRKTGKDAGDFTADAMSYAFGLAVEQLSGEPLDDGFETWQMRRGHELEPDARRAHELAIGEPVFSAGFVTTDDGQFGASADGLIGESGGAEYKCLVSPLELRKVYVDRDLSKYADQVQGCLWITGRAWWDFCLYCPMLSSIGRELLRIRVERDDDYIESMELELVEFSQLRDSYVAKLRAAA